MTLPPPKICQRMRALHAMLGSPNTEEAQTARDKLLKLLTEHGLSWNDLQAIIAATAAADTSSSRAGAAASGAAATSEDDLGIPGNDLLGLILALIEEHVAITAEGRRALAAAHFGVRPISHYAAARLAQSRGRLRENDAARADRAAGR